MSLNTELFDIILRLFAFLQTEIPYLGSQPHPVFYEVPGGCIVHPASTTGEPSAEHGSHPWLCPNGIISFTMHDRVWDSMKCYRSNQDSQRQDGMCLGQCTHTD